MCTRQFCSYRDRAEDFGSLNATVVGISSQSLASHEGFKAKHGLNVPLLADEDRAVAKAYGATMPGVGTTPARSSSSTSRVSCGIATTIV